MVEISWSWSPLPYVLVGAALTAYARAWRQARARRASFDLEALHLRCMIIACVAALVALISPIGRLGEQMFSFHMLQHLLLLDVVPIFVALAVTTELLGPRCEALRAIERRLRVFLHPAVVVVFYAGTMWAWHARPLFELAMGSDVWHAMQHVSFLLAGFLFWWYALGMVRPLRRPRGMGVFMFVTSTKLLTGLLAAAILGTALARYPSYVGAARFDGLSVVEDRQLAGGLMLFEELVVMSIALTFMFVRMLGEDQDGDGSTAEAGTPVPVDTPAHRR